MVFYHDSLSLIPASSQDDLYVRYYQPVDNSLHICGTLHNLRQLFPKWKQLNPHPAHRMQTMVSSPILKALFAFRHKICTNMFVTHIWLYMIYK